MKIETKWFKLQLTERTLRLLGGLVISLVGLISRSSGCS